ncbi:MAG: serine/threonine-protein kinase [Bryobacteraceae bacterium]|nr:serine/threonine-protein kinase [Bryobacteraceae bacterium]
MQVVRAASQTGSSGSPAKPGIQLPPALVEKAAERLCVISVMAAVTTVAMFAAERYLQPEMAAAQQEPVVRLTALFLVLISAGFIAIQRLGLFSKQTVLNLGVLYQVAVAFGIGVFETCIPMAAEEPVRGVSTVTLWITLCALLIPSTPLTSIIASGSSTLAWLGGYFVNLSVLGFAPLPFNRLAIWLFPTLLMIGWTYVLNRRIYEMQVKVHNAEDLGSYKLDYMIDKGGMGEVWRARHRFLARDAAVKLIRPDMLVSQPGRQASVMRRRFELEAKSIARLKSPHTVALFDFGLAQDQSFYYVMELLDGIDLQMLVERFGPLPAARVKKILLDVCESLEEAHRAGMVHRDIKPKNIFVTRLGIRYDFAKVLDFGLVKSLLPTDLSTMTLEGTATGTPAYMAPEVALSQDVDGRSDLYALGCVAYFLLTGQTVFAAGNLAAIAIAHVQQQPVPPSQRTEMPIPASMERIILQCLEKEPAKRLRSAQEMARQLSAAPDIPDWTNDQAHQWWQTHLPEAPARSTPGEPAEELASALS